jgi:hypothetical protein
MKLTRCPTWLKDEAKEFWSRHWSRLVEEGSVSPERDVEGFSLLCEIWRILRNTDPCRDSKEGLRYGAMLKQYNAYGKQYGLFPKDRKQAGFDKPESIADALKKMASNTN